MVHGSTVPGPTAAVAGLGPARAGTATVSPVIPTVTEAELAERVEAELDRRRRQPGPRDRVIVGIAGPPGCGKSTIAASICQQLDAPLVPMDGFHLAHRLLESRGVVDRKGAPDTFDGWGFARCVERLARPAPGEAVYAPEFDRSIEDAIAGAVPVGPGVPVVVTEGNYLLLDSEPWRAVRSVLTIAAYVDLDDTVRRQRLVERHVRFGKGRAAAMEFVERSDEANARIVAASRDRADVILTGT